MHVTFAFHVLFLKSLVVSFQVFHGVAQAFVIRVPFHIMADTLHGLVKPFQVLALSAALQTLLGPVQTLIAWIFLQSLFDALDRLLALSFLFLRLGLLLGLDSGRLVRRTCESGAGQEQHHSHSKYRYAIPEHVSLSF